MKQLRYLAAVLSLAARRLMHQRGLAFSMLLGLTAAVALTVSIPIYADATSYRILNDRLYNNPEDPAPPFSFLFRYVGSWSGYIEWEDSQHVDRYIQESAASTIGLPSTELVRHFKTDRMRLFPAAAGSYDSVGQPLAYVSLGFISDLESHVEVTEGVFPTPVSNNGETVPVLVSSTIVESLGIQPGEEYIVYYTGPQAEGATATTTTTTFQHRVRIAGVWRARNPAEDYWFYRQSAFDEVFLMPEASYVQLASGMKGEVGLAVWSLLAEGSNIHAEDVDQLLGRIRQVRKEATTQLDGLDLARSPEEQLYNYSRTVVLLTISLYVFSVPILGLVFYFISLVSTTIVQRQRNEVAMLRSRGTTALQVIGIYLLEGLLVGVISLVLGSLIGQGVAQIMGLTRSFLRLEDRPFLDTALAWSNLRFGLVALAASLLTSILPAARAARETVVTYKQDRARTIRAPFWQRAYLDLLLLVPALYGYYLLRQRGSLAFIQAAGQTGSPFSNPFLFVVPVVFVFALSLFCIRIFPLVMRILSWAANTWSGVVPVLALRHLSRMARHYTGPMLLLILTLSLAVFTASMARTLDDYTIEQAYYEVGSDFRLIEMGESTDNANPTGGVGEQSAAPEPTAAPEGPEWQFLPVSLHLEIPGVRNAARVWSKQVTLKLPDDNVKANLMGIDRADFARVGFFRSDFAPASFGALMNALAVRDDAILISRDLADLGLAVDDLLSIPIPIGSQPTARFRIGGVVDMFPSLYPEDGPFLIANLDYIFNNAGGIYPYDVWVTTDPDLSGEALLQEADLLGIRVLQLYNARELVDAVQLSPERQGVFGLLSVGFVASAFLTLLGFLIYSYVSFTQRYIELGVLRAVGLSIGQMSVFLVAEQLTLVATGAAAGTGLGILVSRLFIPFFQVQGGTHPFTPPFVVQIAWTEIAYIYVVFGLMFVLGVIVLLLSLYRMRVFEAIKLGEAT